MPCWVISIWLSDSECELSVMLTFLSFNWVLFFFWQLFIAIWKYPASLTSSQPTCWFCAIPGFVPSPSFTSVKCCPKETKENRIWSYSKDTFQPARPTWQSTRPCRAAWQKQSSFEAPASNWFEKGFNAKAWALCRKQKRCKTCSSILKPRETTRVKTKTGRAPQNRAMNHKPDRGIKIIKCEKLQSSSTDSNLANPKFLPPALHLKTTRPSQRFTRKTCISWASHSGYDQRHEHHEHLNSSELRRLPSLEVCTTWLSLQAWTSAVNSKWTEEVKCCSLHTVNCDVKCVLQACVL